MVIWSSSLNIEIVLLTQHHDADEVANDSETACDDGEGPTDD